MTGAGGWSVKHRTMVDYVDRVHEENERLRRENAELRARLAAVKARCEGNNWGGTARMCDHG